MNILTITMYLKMHTLAQDLEEISFVLLIIIRNSSQLLRLCVLCKKHKRIKVS